MLAKKQKFVQFSRKNSGCFKKEQLNLGGKMRSILFCLCGLGIFWGSVLQSSEIKKPVSFGLHTCCPSVFYEKTGNEASLLSIKVKQLFDGKTEEDVYTLEFVDEQELAEALEVFIQQTDFKMGFYSFSCFLQSDVKALALVEKKLEELTSSLEKNNQDFYAASERTIRTRQSTFSSMQGWDLAGDSVGPKTEEAKPFFDLLIREKDKKLIRDLIGGIADTPLLQLMLPSEQNRLKKMGEKARVVHPLRFIGFILADAQMRRQLKDISGSSFKWPRFVEGFEDQMKEEAKKGNLVAYVPGFSELLGAEADVIYGLLQKKNYSGIIEFFL